MMWWDGNGNWGHGWWWPGVLVMAVFMIICMVMMVRMMSHGTHGSHTRETHGHRPDGPERTLAARLARGEIDIDEYERLLEALQRTADPTRT